jgi:hypothetical protein
MYAVKFNDGLKLILFLISTLSSKPSKPLLAPLRQEVRMIGVEVQFFGLLPIFWDPLRPPQDSYGPGRGLPDQFSSPRQGSEQGFWPRACDPERVRRRSARRLIQNLTDRTRLELRLRGDLTSLVVRLRFLLEICLTWSPTCYRLHASKARPPCGTLGLMCEPTAVGRQPHIHIERYPRMEART